MDEVDSNLPLRQITRLRDEMAMSSAQLTAPLFSNQPLLAVEFGIVARVSLPDWITGQTLSRPKTLTRGIPARNLALSLGGPRETVRRHVNQLLERGVLVASEHGIAVANTPENEALALSYYRTIHDLFVRLIGDLAVTTDVALPVGTPATFGISDVIVRGIDTLLLPIDTFRFAKKLSVAFVWSAMTVSTVRRITYDPVLSRLYGDALPPDDLRADISLHQLAGALNMSYTTVWRHIQTLRVAGLVTRLSDDRWTVLSANLMNESVRKVAILPSMLTLRKVRELVQLGFDPHLASDQYIAGRPPLAQFDTGPT